MRGCRRARAGILAESDGELALERVFQLEQHLESCADCRRFRAVELAMREGLAAKPEPVLEDRILEGAVRGVRERLQTEEALSAPRRRIKRSTRWLVAASLCAAAATLAWRSDQAPGPIVEERLAHQSSRGDRARSSAAEPLEHERDVASEATPPRDPRQVREHVRGALAESFAGAKPLERASPPDLALAAASFDSKTAELAESWPVLRFVEDLSSDEDLETALAAIHLLGQRGDRISVLALRAALGREELADATVRSLGALGGAGVGGAECVDGLARALEQPALVDRALEQLVAIGGDQAARAIEESFRARGADPRADALHLEALVDLGAPALDPLLRLAGAGGAERGVFLAQLERLPAQAADLLADRLVAQGRQPDSLLFEATLHLPSSRSLARMEELCLASSREERSRALGVLVAWEGVEPLEAMLRLSRSGRLSDDELLSAARGLLAADPRRAGQLAEEYVATRALEEARELLELLLACGVSESGEACAVLAASPLLLEDERLWAALAAGELGVFEQVASLTATFASTEPGERRLRAALALSIHRLAGDGAVAELVGTRRGEAWERLIQALSEAEERGAAVTLHRVARALDDARARPTTPWRST